MRIPIVSIIGRPNVGKSSLFNRILRRRLAVVDEKPGVTRDRNYAICDWSGVQFYLVDTGGIIPDSNIMMEKLITDQTDFAIHESDLIIFIVDTQVGIDNVDMKIARNLKRAKKNHLLIANKADSDELDLEIFEFLKLGLGDSLPISATGGRGIGEMLDQIIAKIPHLENDEESSEEMIRIALVGRPNVGKSSFINNLIGKERLIVTPIAGTTRDAVDTPFEFENQKFMLIDTAGLRRKYKVYENIEFYTNLRTDRAIESCDVAVVLIDASEGISVQDRRIIEKVYATRRPAVLAVNKWDLIEKDNFTTDRFTKKINEVLSHYAFVPIIYISALSGQRVTKVMSLVKYVFDESRRHITTSQLNIFLQKVINRQHPPAKKGKHIKFYYITQTEIAPPTFVFFSNYPELISKSYVNYLSNQLRKKFGFAGVPIRLKFRKK